ALKSLEIWKPRRKPRSSVLRQAAQACCAACRRHFSEVQAHTAILHSPPPHFLSALASAISREAPVSEAIRFGLAATAPQLSRKVRSRSQFVPQMRKASASASRLVFRSTA